MEHNRKKEVNLASPIIPWSQYIPCLTQRLPRHCHSLKSFLPAALQQLSSKSRILKISESKTDSGRGKQCAASVLINLERLKLRGKKVWLEAASLPLQSVRQTFYKPVLKRSRRAPRMAPSHRPVKRGCSALINTASHPGDWISWPRYIVVSFSPFQGNTTQCIKYSTSASFSTHKTYHPVIRCYVI